MTQSRDFIVQRSVVEIIEIVSHTIHRHHIQFRLFHPTLYYLPCQHYLRPFAILKEPIPLYLIHLCWHIDCNSWGPSGNWKMPVIPLEEPSTYRTTNISTLSTAVCRGSISNGKHLDPQPAHIAAERAREVQQTTHQLL